MNNPSKHQKFEMRVIDRRDILLADYNPRTISKDARQRLKNTLREVGLIQPLIWNQRPVCWCPGTSDSPCWMNSNTTHQTGSGRIPWKSRLWTWTRSRNGA